MAPREATADGLGVTDGDLRAAPDRFVEGTRAEKGMVQLDIEAVGRRLDANPVSIRGRLYYDLDPIYAQQSDGRGGRKPFYLKPDQGNPPLINFPVLEAAYASLAEDRSRSLWSIGIALASFFISLVAVAVGVRDVRDLSQLRHGISASSSSRRQRQGQGQSAVVPTS